MSTYKLPDHIGGYQHLAPETICQEGDIYVDLGKPVGFVSVTGYGMKVNQVKALTGYNIYRLIPVAKQGGLDHLMPAAAAPAFKFADDGTKLWRGKDGGYSPSGYLDDGPDELSPFGGKVIRASAPLADAGACAGGKSECPAVTRPLAGGAGPLPSDAKARKGIPIVTGVLDYFPDALCAVAEASMSGNKQHVPGTLLHWDRSKSSDEADALGRHLIERGKIDKDGVRHSAKLAWRCLALLQKEIEADNAAGTNRII